MQGGEIRPAFFKGGAPFFPQKEWRSPLYPLQERLTIKSQPPKEGCDGKRKKAQKGMEKQTSVRRRAGYW
jgi:hypothetical protein